MVGGGGWRPTLRSGRGAMAPPYAAMASRKSVQKNCLELLADLTPFFTLITQKLIFAICALCWYNFFFELPFWKILMFPTFSKNKITTTWANAFYTSFYDFNWFIKMLGQSSETLRCKSVSRFSPTIFWLAHVSEPKSPEILFWFQFIWFLVIQ